LLVVSSADHAISQTPHQGGFWKCRTGTVKGELGGEDVLGLAAHAHIPTDCALNWSNSHGKIYCFSSRPSLEEFESNPSGLLEKAESFWRHSQPSPSNLAK
jgi:YHS domain-containing protein